MPSIIIIKMPSIICIIIIIDCRSLLDVVVMNLSRHNLFIFYLPLLLLFLKSCKKVYNGYG